MQETDIHASSEHTACVLSDADSRLGMEVWNRKRGRIDTDSVGRHERARRRERENMSCRQTDRQIRGRQCYLEGKLKGAESERGRGEEKIKYVIQQMSIKRKYSHTNARYI